MRNLIVHSYILFPNIPTVSDRRGWSVDWILPESDDWRKHAGTACKCLHTCFVVCLRISRGDNFTWHARINTAFWKWSSYVTVRRREVKLSKVFWMITSMIHPSIHIVFFQSLQKCHLLHKLLFWVAIAVLQLDEVSLYAAGLGLLEQNIHTLDAHGVFNIKVSGKIYKL